MICLSLTAPVLSDNMKALQHYRGAIASFELRADRLLSSEFEKIPEFFAAVRNSLNLEALFTLRTAEDGGSWAHGEESRIKLFVEVLGRCEKGDVDWIDLETDRALPRLEELAAEKDVGLIRSFHSFAGTPADLGDRVAALYRGYPAKELAKAAVMCRSNADLLTIVAACEKLRVLGRPFIVLGMGPIGVPTRVLARKFGSYLTFASPNLDGTASAAPGHMDPFTLEKVFRYSAIGPQTKLFGIIGNPVMHSKSPWYHNEKFAEAGLDAVYLPFQVDDVPAFFKLADEIGLQGFSVTVPHKEAVLAYLTHRGTGIEEIGACNTLVREADGWRGVNTDAPGFYRPLGDILEKKEGAERNALILGAGGAARAACQALLSAGFRLYVINRSVERAQQLVADFDKTYPGKISAGTKSQEDLSFYRKTASEIKEYTKIIVQTTNIGMEGEFEGIDPLSWYQFSGDELVYDIVYTPPETPLLQRAKKAGCTILNGLPMFLEQAALQSRLFVERAFNPIIGPPGKV